MVISHAGEVGGGWKGGVANLLTQRSNMRAIRNEEGINSRLGPSFVKEKHIIHAGRPNGHHPPEAETT